MTIVQDYKDFIKSYVNLKKLKKELDVFCKGAVKDCSITEYHENHIKALDLPERNVKISNEEYWNWVRLEHRSTSCFFKVPEPQFVVDKCVNVRLDGQVFECCKKCPNYDVMKELADFITRIEQAEKVRNEAALKLLSNLFFWKKQVNK